MRRESLLVLVVAFLVLTGVVLAQTGDSELLPPYMVEQGAVSGGGYRLTSLVWQICGTSSASGYQLTGPSTPTLRGSGCCCTYLPMLMRNAP